ncbi:MAG: hypothetical protein DWB59_06355, partial [Anaerolineae bacterium]|nr:hypothetical protein [Anaerolineae bacterium]
IATESRADGKYPKYDVEKMGGIDKFMRLLVASEAQALREGKVVVDPQAVNYGWNRFQFEGPGGIPIETKFYGPIYNVNDSQKREPPYKVVSIGLIDGSMFDSKYKGREVYLMGIAINNPNSTSDPRKMTTGILHIEITKLNLPWFLENINNGVKGILFMGKVRISENSDWEDEPSRWGRL